MAILTVVRTVVQVLVLVALNAHAFGVPQLPWLVVPVLHPTQSPLSVATGAYDAMEYSMTHGIPPLIAVGIIFLTGILVGKLFCGWACPMGFAQDIIAYIPYPKKKLSPSTTNQLKDIKWGIVAFSILCCIIAAFRRSAFAAAALRAGSTVVQPPLGVFSDSPFNVISPAGTLFAYLPYMLIWPVTTVLADAGMIGWIKVMIFVATVSACILVPRFFCRFVCPLAALLELVFPYKFLCVKCTKVSKDKVNSILDDVCPMGCQQQAPHAGKIDHPNCIHCGNCISADSHFSTALAW